MLGFMLSYGSSIFLDWLDELGKLPCFSLQRQAFSLLGKGRKREPRKSFFHQQMPKRQVAFSRCLLTLAVNEYGQLRLLPLTR